MRNFLYGILFLAFAGILCIQARAQTQALELGREGDLLHVAAPKLHFLEGKPLEKLHDGASVTFVLTLTAGAEDGKAHYFRLQERFVVSFDLWEEKFSVLRTGPGGRSASRLSAAMAEAWCLENMPMPVRVVPAQEPFVIRLECGIADNGEESGGDPRTALTLAGLIDVFSRKKSEAPPRWEAAAGPLRLQEVKTIRRAR
jgi:hypothetical protein